ncbi:hypothetical protein Cni_G12640 [Canna indica]|uniref:Uncharacterized protein n=1 Tax=Canna indica TaxID=4628 RepID=A0AAQ3KA84_9LILI|nr:hypothetical protein Cni_G12640 [Canna indica]
MGFTFFSLPLTALISSSSSSPPPLLLLLLLRHRRRLLLLLLLDPYEILVTVDTNPVIRPLASLLPHPFGPYDLLHKGAPRLLEPHHNELDAVEAAKDNGTARWGLERRLRKVADWAIIARVVQRLPLRIGGGRRTREGVRWVIHGVGGVQLEIGPGAGGDDSLPSHKRRRRRRRRRR